MKLDSKMTMREFALEVGKALKEHGIDVVLTGGAVVSIYSEGKYVSKDLDFLSTSDYRFIGQTMQSLGFEQFGKDFFHNDVPYSVEFPGMQLIIGDEPMKPEGKIQKGNFTLTLLSPTQCIMDRLAAFYHWNDRPGLEQAVLVGRAHPINLKKIESWSINEGMKDRYLIFVNLLKSK